MAFTLKNFVFFDSSSTASESEVMGSLENAEEMALQVTGSGTINLTIQAKSDTKNGTWQNLSCVNLNGLKVCNSITSNGIYNVPLTGMAAIKILNSGSAGVNVYGRIIG